jgi:hypothetical protein
MMRSYVFLLFSLAGCGRLAELPSPTPAPSPAAYRACLADLEAQGVRFTPVADRINTEVCRIEQAGVLVADFGVRSSMAPGRVTMTCGLAQDLTGWRRDLDPLARELLGAEVQAIEHMGVYACRNVNSAATGRPSAHARAAAIDVAAFRLTDGRRVSVVNDWTGGGAEARFLRAVRDAGCRRFGTVLSPDYNDLHRDHLHLEASGRLCR